MCLIRSQEGRTALLFAHHQIRSPTIRRVTARGSGWSGQLGWNFTGRQAQVHSGFLGLPIRFPHSGDMQ